jgi:fumarylacetoacetase
MKKSWLDIDPASEFSLWNLPLGIISTKATPQPHVAVAIGSYALDLLVLSTHKDTKSLLKTDYGHKDGVFEQPTLNALAQLGRKEVSGIRLAIHDVLIDGDRDIYDPFLRDDPELQKEVLIPLSDVKMHLPMQIGDYTDFYAGMHHAVAVGTMFRGPENALQPNYKHLPVGYHGRSSSIVVSGTPIHRPQGQILDPSSADPKLPTTCPSKKLDFELELGCFISRPNEMGKGIAADDADDYIFGYVLLNDWSARDIQAWEYVPLGPFNGKNFATTISPWVVHPTALDQFLSTGIPNDTPLQPYLQQILKLNVFDIQLEVHITSQ